jgi:hypothetical protein
MTGAYLRVKRDGEWKNIEVEHLTYQERNELIGKRPVPEIMRWLDLICETLVKAEADIKSNTGN